MKGVIRVLLMIGSATVVTFGIISLLFALAGLEFVLDHSTTNETSWVIGISMLIGIVLIPVGYLLMNRACNFGEENEQ